MSVDTYVISLTDLGESPVTGATPRVWVEGAQDAFGVSKVLAGRRRIPVALNASGFGSVNLTPSTETTPRMEYVLRCEWLDEERPVGYARWSFFAEPGGGYVAAMGRRPQTGDVVAGFGPPPAGVQNVGWIDMTDETADGLMVYAPEGSL